jgi:dsRNA-specific ribonuclease
MEEKLKNFLNKFLSKFIPDKSLIRNFLTEKSLKVFLRAFTSITVDPEENYERLEYIGDKMIASAVSLYLYQNFRNFDEEALTDYFRYLTANNFYLKISRNLRLSEFIRISNCAKKISKTKVEEDIFESFVGALIEVSEDIEKGLSFKIVYSFISYVFSIFPPPEDIEEAFDKKTAVIQIFGRFKSLGIEEPKEDSVETQEGYLFRLKLSEKEINFLRDKGFPNVPSILASTKNEIKKKAEVEAYKEAYKKLKELGITIKWAEDEKKKLDFSLNVDESLKQAFFEKMQEYSEYYFVTPKKLKEKKGTLVMLVAKKDGKKLILHQKSSKNTNKNEEFILKAKIIEEIATGNFSDC